jgi:hypothetical protein
MGQKIDFEDGDTGKQKTLFFSESIALYSVEEPNHSRTDVLATKVSGESDGFGLALPNVLPFYDNNIIIGKSLNPRGFISPISENALAYYKYKYEGAFFENGVQISRIRVIPRRKYEPLFTGIINIVEDEWRLHSVQVELLKDYGLRNFDTLRIEQLYAPLPNSGVWVIQSQVVYPAIKIFNFDGYGSFVNVYSKYDLNPHFPKKYFDNTILKYTDSSNKKTEDFWALTRPMALQQEELDDYRKKDSLEQVRKSPEYQDSIDRQRNKATLSRVMLSGQSFSSQKTRTSIAFSPIIETVSYNIVEGTVVNLGVKYIKRIDTSVGRRALIVAPELRYGFGNGHFNPNLTLGYRFGRRFPKTWTVSGGSDVYQFNNANPVSPFLNTIATLVSGMNKMKIYEARFGKFNFTRGGDKGFVWNAGLEYQDRHPLENTTGYSFLSSKDEAFEPNYPTPAVLHNIPRHQALIATVGVQWQPGARYLEFPGEKFMLGSIYPMFYLTYSQGMQILGSDVDYSKWSLSITDDLNLKLLGEFSYLVDIGGFLHTRKVQSPDYKHYRGTATQFVESYAQRFQLIQNYDFSNTSDFYTAFYGEHHFNGFLTNKIPFLNKWKWNLVAGANGLVINPRRLYLEPYVGLENIFRFLRVDYVFGYEQNGFTRHQVRIGAVTSFSRK